jgi:hypothetical protein
MPGGIAVVAMGVGCLLFSVLFGALRSVPSRDSRDPSLTPLERMGAAQGQAAVRLARPLLWMGVALVGVGGIAMLIAAVS